ncbi:hypothetical protein HanPI659440_Chr03g0132921 [Helianthus annuus]|nr:hypothetical protein HanPI659440_Chr03g0132921 [Helianthus annuus]
MKQVEKQTHKSSPINTTVLIRMKVPVTSTMFTNLTCKLSLCVCVFRTECSQLYLSVCVHLSVLNTLHGYIYPASDVWSEGSDRWSEGSSIEYMAFEGSAGTSKGDLSRSIIRNISKHIFRVDRRIYIILRSLILRDRQTTNIF